ncbi:hypothetical protein B0187_04965 [Haemophilus paracuniculus]|uniref:Uncharacterized protein n=1 Tax=Haemophilus paracuniculus TaxID=734 RepID=A0A1T0ASD3_9PAST|nr:hypothetical protein [Haemophilus paracuniculus]OOR99444.1 hypothetical protein B0187_04965 [Haemophilus paracuniculus]
MWQIFNLERNEIKSTGKKWFTFNFFRPKKTLSTPDQIREATENFPDFTQEFDTILKFWLPEMVYQCIQEQRKSSRFSIAEIIRDFCITHCYGKTASMHLQRNNRWKLDKNILAREAPTLIQQYDSAFSLSVPDLGKSIYPIKICIHHKLKNDLIILADLRGMSLSEYLREILTTYYLGNGFLPNQNDLMKSEIQQELEKFLNEEDEVIQFVLNNTTENGVTK